MKLNLWTLRSLRLRAVLVVLGVTAAPLVLVAASSFVESGVDEALREDVERAALEVAAAPAADFDALSKRASSVAEEASLRVRIIDAEGRVWVDHDRDPGSAAVSAASSFFFGPDDAPTLVAFDRDLRGLRERAEIIEARRSTTPQVGCRNSPAGKLLVCHAAMQVQVGTEPEQAVVYVQESSRRAIRALYDLRYQLLKLTLVVLPGALLLAWWLGWRMVRPIEKLQRQVQRHLELASRSPGVRLRRRDEFGELAHAFNELLGRLDLRARENEAFVADLAHEFKNPVAAIRASAEALQAAGGPVDAKRAQRLARVLSDSSRRLDVLVTQLLELARAEAGMVGEQREPVDLAELAREVVRLCADDERYEGVAFEVEALDHAPVEGVAVRLESAVSNLVENAASFTSTQGGLVHVQVAREGGVVILEVRDDGPGIPPEDLPRVFDRFFTTREHRQGTGLGLALVRAVVEAHQGRISVESTPGEGASFRLELPALVEEEKA